jgi:hypothetical protein
MLGKLAARIWMQNHRGQDMGFKLDVSSCCRNMKIAPGRSVVKRLGFHMQYTGQRGQVDDSLRGMRDFKDGTLLFNQADKLWICNPRSGWTDMMIRRYIAENKLPQHPAKARGAKTIGCLFCGGGAQFTNSGFRVLRRSDPDAWRRFMVEWKAGEIVLAIKYDRPLALVRQAIELLGGLDVLAAERPWVFDFTSRAPLPGYEKG